MNFLKQDIVLIFFHKYIYILGRYTHGRFVHVNIGNLKGKKITNLNNVEVFFRVGGVLECELTLSLDSGGRNGKLLLMYQRFYK